jgi:hypothetical protein
MKEIQNIKIRRELIDLLDELNIENFTLNTEEKKLIIYYKEDFDIFFPKLNACPECFRDSAKVLPYTATHYTFFDYQGWDIRGNIVNNKSAKGE